MTDTIAQLSSELASAQAKLISSLLDNQRLLKRISDKGGIWNTSGGGTDGKTYGGGAAGPWDGPSIHYCHTHGHNTSKQVVDIALLCLAKTGVFNNDLKEWNRLPLLDRTWPKFRVHFAKAHREWRANLRLTAG